MLCARGSARPPSTKTRVLVDGTWYVFAGPLPAGGKDSSEPQTRIPAFMYPDDSVALALRRVEALVPGAAGHRYSLPAGAKGALNQALLGPRQELRLERQADGRPSSPEEHERARQIAELLDAARSHAPNNADPGFTACRFTRWVSAVPPPQTSFRALEDAYHNVDAVDAVGLVRLVAWHGGEPEVRVKPNRNAPVGSPVNLDALRGFQPDPDDGDLLEVFLSFPTANVGGVARMLVRPDGGYRVLATADPFDGAEDASILAMHASVGVVARRLGLRAPVPDKDLVALTVHAELRTAGRPPGPGSLRDAVVGRFYPLFAAEASKAAVHLEYKRVAGFDDPTRVREWLAERTRGRMAGATTPAALAAVLRDTFLTLDADEATFLAEGEIRRKQQQQPQRRRRRRGRELADAVEASLAPAREFFGYRVVAKGVQSLAQWRQLQADLAAVVGGASGAAAAGRRRLTSFDEAPTPLQGEQTPGSQGSPSLASPSLAATPIEERGDIIRRLYEADRNLFQLQGKQDIYARHCGRHELRQPVVVRAADRVMAGVSALAYGSTPEKAAENAYACPAIWCPQSGVALKPKPHPLIGRDGKRRAGVPADKARAIEKKYQAQYVCPNAKSGERPLFLYTSAYWGHNPSQPRHVGFHSTKKNAAGMCLPCCFKLPKDRVVRECTGKDKDASVEEAGDQDDADRAGDDDQNADGDNAKYVLSDNVVPIKHGRYGALPRAFRSLLPERGYLGKGFAARGRYLLREGLAEHRPSSIASALATLAGLPSARALIADVRARLTPDVLMQLENGQVLLRLLETRGSVSEDATSPAARKWFGDPNQLAQAGELESQRQDALWRGFHALLTYIEGPSADPRLLYDLVGRLYGFALGVFEADGQRAWFDCPTFVDYESEGEMPFGLLLRQGTFYEPLVIATASRSEMSAVRMLKRDDAVVSRLLKTLVSTCDVHVGKAIDTVEEGVVDAVVLRRDLLVVATLRAGGLLVPFDPPLPSGHVARLLAAHRDARVVHLEDLGELSGPANLVAALTAAAPNLAPTRRADGTIVVANGAWEYSSLLGAKGHNKDKDIIKNKIKRSAYIVRCVLPVGPAFYAVPNEDDRVLWETQQRHAETEYQTWKRGVLAKQTKAPGKTVLPLKKLMALAPRAHNATYWAQRLMYEMETGIDVGPSSESSAHVRESMDVSQTDIDTMRFSRTPVL